MYHKLLERQIAKYLGPDACKEGLEPFLKAVSESYLHYDRDRKLLEHSIDITSKELTELNRNLKKETEESSNAVFDRIRESLEILKDDNLDLPAEEDQFKLLHIADILKEETQRRKLAEKERKRREAQLRESQRIAHVGSWEVELDAQGAITEKPHYWSEETYNIFGLDTNTLVNTELFQSLVHPDDLQMLVNGVKESIEKRGSYNLVHRVILPDGTEKTVQEQAIIFTDRQTGIPIKMIGTVQDITERRTAELQLQQAHSELRLLFENMREIFYVVDMENYRLLQISRACEEVYGRGIGEFMENPNLWYEVVLDEDKGIINANYPVMNEGKPFTQEYRIRHTNGDVRWLESKMTPVLNEDGKLVRLYGVSADITDRKSAETALKTSERKFRSLIENSSDLITVANENMELVFVSDSSYRITGFTVEEVLGMKSFTFAHPDDRESVQRIIDESFREPGTTKKIIYRTAKKDGTYFWCERLITNLLDEPAVKGIVSNMRDVTEHIEYEETLKNTNEDLKKTNMELDKFVYSVSHDLRAPLASILGLTEYALGVESREEILTYLEMIKRSVLRLDGFIKDILDYSRNSRLEVAKEKIDLREMMNEITGNLKFMSEQSKHINLQIDISDNFDFHCDRSRVYIILNNLVSNAIRYQKEKAEEGWVKLYAKAECEKVLIEVSDNGVGIAPENRDKVFDMFFRASKKSVGSGLGLYIVKEAVNKLNGTIRLSSEPGKGSTFTLSIPNNQTNSK